jgi:hypothetical protein
MARHDEILAGLLLSASDHLALVGRPAHRNQIATALASVHPKDDSAQVLGQEPHGQVSLRLSPRRELAAGQRLDLGRWTEVYPVAVPAPAKNALTARTNPPGRARPAGIGDRVAQRQQVAPRDRAYGEPVQPVQVSQRYPIVLPRRRGQPRPFRAALILPEQLSDAIGVEARRGRIAAAYRNSRRVPSASVLRTIFQRAGADLCGCGIHGLVDVG